MTASCFLGIDAGGTYTDLVLLDSDLRRVVNAVKVSTTRPDPSTGIREGLGRLDPELLKHVSMVSLATTFATNAIVEEVGAEAGLVLIGYGERPEVLPGNTRVMMLAGGHTVAGQEREPLDLDALRRGMNDFVRGLDAVAVAGFFSVRNPAHEIAVADVLRKHFNLPTVRGHRLSMRLDAFKRATTAWWNARLIPLISNLIRACHGVLDEYGLRAPLMVVRGDGTLMSAETALVRPVDTLLSGPAASILGSRYLAGVEDCLIVDMGGTTTDMAVLAEGRVRIDPQGARVGRWETHVEAARVRTIGLGGDSLIGLDGRQAIQVGPRRVVPLCVQAERHPDLLPLLERLCKLAARARCRVANPCAFFFPAERPGEIVSEFLLWTDSTHWFQALDLDEAERRGRYLKSGLTPTDLRVAAGGFTLGNPEAARMGRRIMALSLGMGEETLAEKAEEFISRRLCEEAAAFVAEDDREALTQLTHRWYPASNGRRPGVHLDLRLTLTAPVVGVGAPAPASVARAFRHLGADVVLPDGYDVSVAVGAVVGLVDRTLTAVIRPDTAGGWNLHGPEAKMRLSSHDEAVEEGRRMLEAGLIEEMRVNLVPDPLLDFQAIQNKAQAKGREEIHLETRLTLRATGRPAVG